MTLNGPVSPEVTGDVPLPKIEFLRCYDLITDIAEGQDLSYRVDEAKAVLEGMARYLSQVIDVTEQDVP
jgi:hypothetical protein